MSNELIVILVVIGWIGFGPVLSVFMGRRGHSAAAWGITGMFLGPLAVPLALAADGAYDLVVIGTRGRGLSPRLLGSVASELAGSAPLPVLVGGAPPRRDHAGDQHPSRQLVDLR